jgi:hypothetical protein
MKLAIMQPYFFPYIGYWQLLNAADRFVIYDDVSFIKRGWVNRNRILINGKPSYITVPLSHASQNKRICDLSLQASPDWQRKMIKSIENAYRRSPYFPVIFSETVKQLEFQASNLAEFLAHHLGAMASLLGINTEFVTTSRCYENSDLGGQDRILDICKSEGAKSYVNLQGGQNLYDSERFDNANIELRFIMARPTAYKQRTAGFLPNLSIIDALMEIGVEGVKQRLGDYEWIAIDQ